MSRSSHAHIKLWERLTRTQELALGALVLAVSGLIVVLGYAQPNPFADKQTVRAVFDDAAGMGVVEVEVRIAGVAVGEVTDRKRIGDDALVTMELDADLEPVYADATAELRPRIAFEGTSFVDLQPGSATRGRLGDRTIPKSRTRNYIALDKALRFARPDTRAALKDDVRDLSGALQPEARQGIQKTLRGAPRLTRDLRIAARAAQGRTGAELAGAVKGLSDTMDALAREEESLGPLIRGSDRTLAALNVDSGRALDRTIAELPARLEGLERGSRSLIRVVDQVDPFAVELRPGAAQLGPTLRRLRPLLAEARPVLRGAPPLVSELRRAIAAGGRSTPSAERLLAALQPSLDLLDESLLPALSAKTELGLPTYLQFLNLFQGGGGASRPFQTAAHGKGTEVLGSGHFMRFGARFLAGPGIGVPPCAIIARANPILAQLLYTQGLCSQ